MNTSLTMYCFLILFSHLIMAYTLISIWIKYVLVFYPAVPTSKHKWYICILAYVGFCCTSDSDAHRLLLWNMGSIHGRHCSCPVDPDFLWFDRVVDQLEVILVDETSYIVFRNSLSCDNIALLRTSPLRVLYSGRTNYHLSDLEAGNCWKM